MTIRYHKFGTALGGGWEKHEQITVDQLSELVGPDASVFFDRDAAVLVKENSRVLLFSPGYGEPWDLRIVDGGGGFDHLLVVHRRRLGPSPGLVGDLMFLVVCLVGGVLIACAVGSVAAEQGRRHPRLKR